MNEPDIPPQAHFLYDGRFSESLDAFMLDGLVMWKQWYKWRGLDVPSEVMMQIHKEMNALHEVRFTPEEIYHRLQFLQKRYAVFKALVDPKTGTQWVYDENKVTAHDKTWRKLFKADAFNIAYYYFGEPQIKKLLVLFGIDEEIKQEAGKSVIVISDSTEVVEIEPGSGKEASGEVTSPVNQAVGARRRLFKMGPEDANDECSTNQINEIEGSGRLYSPTRYNSAFHESISGDEGSYCASSDLYSSIISIFKNP